MKCPICYGKTKVIDTRHTSDNETYRKRKCVECDHEFLSIEFEVFLTEKVMEKWNKCERTRLKRMQQ